MRINKYLQLSGVGSRREAERLVEAGKVTVDGVVAGVTTAVEEGMEVRVDGRVVAPEAADIPRIFMYHKPVGVIVTARDHEGRKTLYEALAEAAPGLPRVMPVGRLDLNSEGLLLLTTDGMLAQTLMSPKTALKRVYRVRVLGELNPKQLEMFEKGFSIGDIWYRGAEVTLEKTGESGKNRWYRIVLSEGKNREIRRIFEHFGCQVNRLQRVAYGPFELGDLAKGEVVEETENAVKSLLAEVGRGV
ncbi:MAG: pseudouridine synthase [Proteobacteria bacterium]|nr:pseudouridine synthase [Pseudomonadota bacterium]